MIRYNKQLVNLLKENYRSLLKVIKQALKRSRVFYCDLGEDKLDI